MLHTRMSRDVAGVIFARVEMENSSHDLVVFWVSLNPLFAFLHWYQATSGFHGMTLKVYKYLIAMPISF